MQCLGLFSFGYMLHNGFFSMKNLPSISLVCLCNGINQ